MTDQLVRGSATVPPADQADREAGARRVAALRRWRRIAILVLGWVAMLALTIPRTRNGKLLRRAIQAVCEGRDPGDLTTIEDPTALQQIKELVAAK